MPPQIVHPGEYVVTGIFLLSKDDLLELDSLFDDIKKDVNGFVNQQISNRTKKEIRETTALFEKLGCDKQVDKETIRNEIKRKYPFNRREHRVVMVCRSKYQITGKSFAEIIESPELEKEWPMSASVNLRYGEADVNIGILSSLFRNHITVSVSVNISSVQRAGRKLNEWAESKRRVEMWRRLALGAGFTGFMILFCCLILLPTLFFRVKSDSNAHEITSRSYARQSVVRRLATAATRRFKEVIS